jgi:hypothetical protein
MRRRKYREWRNSAWERKWLQRELEASGMILDGPPARKIVPPPSTTPFETVAVRPATPTRPRHAPRRTQETRLFN